MPKWKSGAGRTMTPEARPKQPRKTQPTLVTLINRGALGAADDPETRRKIRAAHRWYCIMKCEPPEPGATAWNFYGCPISSSVDSTKADRWMDVMSGSIAAGKAAAILRSGLTDYFTKVLDAIIVDNKTVKQAAFIMFGRVNARKESNVIDRLNSALIAVDMKFKHGEDVATLQGKLTAAQRAAGSISST